MTNLGYGYLLQPPPRADDDAAFRQTISHMNLEEVKHMMCPKSGGDPDKCRLCDGFRSCLAGQRVLRLVSENTDQPEKVSTNPTSIEREEFKKACESGNAWHYLMITRHLSKDSAGELLSRLIKKYPGIAADFGGGRRIMQRPKVVKLTDTITETDAKPSQTAQNVPQPPSAPLDEQIPTQTQTAPNGAKKPEKTAQSTTRREKARDYIRQVLSQENPRQYLADTEGLTMQQARKKLENWRQRNADLFEGVTIPKLLASERKAPIVDTKQDRRERYERYTASEDPVGAYAEDNGTNRHAAAATLRNWKRKFEEGKQMDEPPEPTQAAPNGPETDDQISLEDFLAQMGEPAQTGQITPETTAKPETHPGPVNIGSGDLSDMVNELAAEKARLLDEIKAAEERIKWIEEQQDALQKVLALFGRAVG